MHNAFVSQFKFLIITDFYKNSKKACEIATVLAAACSSQCVYTKSNLIFFMFVSVHDYPGTHGNVVIITNKT